MSVFILKTEMLKWMNTSKYVVKEKVRTLLWRKVIKQRFKFFLILDFEATCDNTSVACQEIIEFPCLKVNGMSMEEEGRFHHYVCPVFIPTLTPFCTELTGILQEMVDDEPTFPDVMSKFEDWRRDEGITDENSLYVTYGDWDLGLMLPAQCRLSGIPLPSHMKQWLDIRQACAETTHHFPKSLNGMVNSLGLKFKGRHHSGIDDSLNILEVMQKLSERGCIFQSSSKYPSSKTTTS